MVVREKPTNKRIKGAERAAAGRRDEEARETEAREPLFMSISCLTVHHKGNKREQLHRRQVQFAPRYYKKVERLEREKEKDRGGGDGGKERKEKEREREREDRQKRGLMARGTKWSEECGGKR